jgi:phosphatidylethanolamine-binding protein (PEBP) family uncharacterized protein
MGTIASARWVPALAALITLSAGCGGGADAQTSTSSSQDDSTSGTAAAKQAPSGREAAADESAKAASGGGSVASGADGGKHGPRVSVPTGPRESPVSPTQRSQATVADVSLSSPEVRPLVGGGALLGPEHTCDGADTPPSLRWRGIPADAAELVILAMNVKPVEGKLFYDWAVAGLDPALDGLDAGRLPKGAIVGRNSFGKVGYSICPAAGGETYVFALLAPSKALSPGKGFDPHVLREQALAASGDAGLMAASYDRG